ncbi:MAG: hypothetical protein R3C13_11940 [Hyphomonas sp.]|uniref:phosphatidylserine decarboxylase n=1 Tax=Hyphomonas sp. TaxID=87 RepID=UPI003527EAA9
MDDLERKSTPWLNGGFDVEGIAAALAALLVALLLGWIWAPLFWIGFAAAVAALFAARWANRTPPEVANGVVAPVDGMVVSVGLAEVPPELRLDQKPMTRIRISSAPTATNKVYTPISGSLENAIVEDGDNSIPFAMRPDDEGLARAFMSFESQGDHVGVKLASGGFGPRLDIDMVAGDIARLGRPCGTRRLGGWCDVFLPAHAAVTAWPGQSLVGGETVIGRLGAESEIRYPVAEAKEEDAFEPKVEEAEDMDDDYLSPDEADMSEDPAVLFARLREAARRSEEGD